MSEAPVIYTNRCQIFMRPFDLVIDMLRVEPSSGEGHREEPAVPVAKVYMSPQHARSLQRLLERCTAAWEEQYGMIQEPSLTFEGVMQ